MMHKIQNSKTGSQSGFSLIEIVITTGMIGILSVLAAGIFSRFLIIQRHDVAQQAVQEDVRFALELINREIRTGYGSTFALADSEGKGVTFRNQNGACIYYRLNVDSERLERAEASVPGEECEGAHFSNAAFAPITSSDTQFHLFRFDAMRSGETSEGLPDRQGFITVMMEATARRQHEVAIALQSTVTSRQVSIFEPQ